MVTPEGKFSKPNKRKKDDAMAKDSKPRKTKHDKFYTRAKAERLLTAGADPTETFNDEKGAAKGRFTDHPNKHVRAKAEKKIAAKKIETPAA